MTTTRSAAVFILTHGRPDNIKTLDMLQRSGYTGKIHIVIDNEDARADEYFERYGDMVLQFDKKAVADRIDDADTSGDRRAIIYARHAAQDMAKELGYDYMLQLDDDYADLRYRFIKNGVLWRAFEFSFCCTQERSCFDYALRCVGQFLFLSFFGVVLL